MDWPCHKNAWWSATKESILLRTSGGKVLARWPEQMLQRHSKSLPKGFQHGNRLHWIERSSVSSSEREQMTMKQRESAKLKENAEEVKARAKGSSSESSFSELTCSICNRQFRAKISHQRTHQHTWIQPNQRLRWSFSHLRDEPSDPKGVSQNDSVQSPYVQSF